MTQQSYKAIRVQQKKDSKPFYLLTVSAEELLSWADVPRKKAEFMAGYQRQLDDRHNRITDFLQLDPNNVIPGAVIVAVKDDAVTITDPDDGIVTITVAIPGEFDLIAAVSSSFDRFWARLSPAEQASAQEITESLRQATEPTDLSGDEEPEEDVDDENIVPESYLATIAAELDFARKEFESLPEVRQSAVKDYLEGMAKPGLILDGQHRVFGAKNVEAETIQLPIVLMPGLSEEEQVFHFYVLNNKARPLRPTELRATVSTSLTNQEIDDLETRLKQAGVKSEEAAWTHKINTDPRSPFRGLVDFGREAAVIPENVMYQVAKRFLKPPPKYRLLFSNSEKWGESEDYRLRCFYAIWEAVQEKYTDAWQTAVESKENEGRQILFKANLLVLQDYLLDYLLRGMPKRMKDKQASPLDDIDDLREEIESALYFLPEEFFTKEWMQKGLDHKSGRELLRASIEQAINQQGKNLGNMVLFLRKS